MRNPLLIVSLMLFSAGCTAISTLEAVVNATDAAIPILQAAGVQVPQAAVTYIQAVSDCTATQNGSTAPPDSQLLAIAGCLSTTVAPTLPTGAASTVVAILGVVASDVAKFLAQHPAPPAMLAKAKDPLSNVKALSANDVAKLHALESKAADISNRCRKIKYR
jgi:hypothetical protein